jgi:23S rRNA (cytidine1920-2'-O)/16S rRNA (cytidine1409-2'-O)-methyltransferase
MRLDILLTERGITTGRDRAKAMVMAGKVYVDGQKADKPGMQVDEDCNLELRGEEQSAYVSRGGQKLARALEAFGINLDGAVCMDIGASTGGFTDCMLQGGAQKVYAVDVGYGQLAWKLRENPRVIVMERTNIRNVTHGQIPEPLDFCGVDVSFISLSLVLPVANELLKPGGLAVCLCKPQFEAGKGKVGKKGVVRDPGVHLEVLEKVQGYAKAGGFAVLGADFSPIRGPQGNIEYLVYMKKSDGDAEVAADELRALVERSHRELPERGHGQ